MALSVDQYVAQQQDKVRLEATSKRRHEITRAVQKKAKVSRKKKITTFAESVRRKRGQAREATPVRVMKTVVAVPPVVLPPRSQGLYNLVPKATEYPTAKMVGNTNPVAGTGIPWSINPMAVGIPFVKEIIGTLFMMIATDVVAQFASKISGSDMMGLSYNVKAGRSMVRVRVDTGRGPGRGRYVRPRAEGGEQPDDDADPYEQPSEWWEFWKWGF